MQLFAVQLRALHRAQPMWQSVLAAHQGGGSRVGPGGKQAICSWVWHGPPCIPPTACSCTNHFHFITELFWALPALLECFSDIIQDIMGTSGFKIMSCPLVTEAVSITAQQYAN